MAKIKGKFITLTGSLMSLYPDSRDVADKQLFAKTGKHWNELDPEGWYDTSLMDQFMKTYAKASPTGERAIVNLGRQVYPTIKKSSGLPPNLKTPLEFLKFEADGFMANHNGTDVKPRKFIAAQERNVVVQAPAPGYDSKLFEGVYLGILEMCGVPSGKVEQTKSQEKGDPTSEFKITW